MENGQLIDWGSAQTHVLTHGLHYATSVFEGIRAYATEDGPAIFRAEAHYDRLLRSADTYYLKSPYTTAEFIDATVELIAKNQLKSCYIRPILYAGYSEMGIYHRNNPVDTVIAAWEWGSYLGEEGVQNGIRVTISPWEKFSSKALPATAKCAANYANSVLAKVDATERGFDEALLLNHTGNVAEGPGENLFVIKGSKIVTPQSQPTHWKALPEILLFKSSKIKGFRLKLRKSLNQTYLRRMSSFLRELRQK